jgi:N-acetylneuraminic acid mutarotase
MIVFGGYNHQVSNADPLLDDGAIYHLCSDTWTSMSTAGVPHAITDTVAQRPAGVWTGSELLVWGGFQSGTAGYEEGEEVSFATRYSATTDKWSDMNRDGEPTARDNAVRVWIGDKLLVWGGVAQSGDRAWVNHADGALYDPKSDRWTAMSNAGAPSGGYATDRAVWTGKQLVVWGGLSYGAGNGFDPVLTSLDAGGVYDAASDTWTAIPSEGAPHGGLAPFAWTGKELMVVSKLDGYSTSGQILFEGGRFDPERNAWSPMSTPSLELADTLEPANLKVYWVGSVLAVFGVKVGQGPGGGEPTLLLYDPENDEWTGATVPSVPRFFNWQSTTVVGDRLVVMGPGEGSADARDAHHESTAIAVFDAQTRSWTSLPAALNRSQPGLVALPNHALIWGGKDVYTDLDAPNPCLGATGPCDPITPTIQTLLADGAGISY